MVLNFPGCLHFKTGIPFLTTRFARELFTKTLALESSLAPLFGSENRLFDGSAPEARAGAGASGSWSWGPYLQGKEPSLKGSPARSVRVHENSFKKAAAPNKSH